MGVGLAVLFGIFLAAVTCVVAGRMSRGLTWLPVAVVALGLLLLLYELARFDHGYADALFVFGFLLAPLGLIVAGSLWGSGRFYGWPNLGPHPGRVAVLCLAVLAGVLAGTNRKHEDVAESKRVANGIRTSVLGWRDAHDGAWPARLEEVVDPFPTTAMGILGPPSYEYLSTPEETRISFLASSGLRLVLDLETGTWREERR